MPKRRPPSTASSTSSAPLAAGRTRSPRAAEPEGSAPPAERERSGRPTEPERSTSAAARDPSALAAALDSVGDRWTLLIVEALLDGPLRFGDLQEALPGIAPNVLTQRLRRLEGEGLVVAQPYSERPPRFVYELSAGGGELAGALRLLADWGARHREGAEPPRHAACGSPVEARWWCPVCERPVDEDEAADLHFA